MALLSEGGGGSDGGVSDAGVALLSLEDAGLVATTAAATSATAMAVVVVEGEEEEDGAGTMDLMATGKMEEPNVVGGPVVAGLGVIVLLLLAITCSFLNGLPSIIIGWNDPALEGFHLF